MKKQIGILQFVILSALIWGACELARKFKGE